MPVIFGTDVVSMLLGGLSAGMVLFIVSVGPVGHHGADGLRQPRAWRLRHARRLRHRAGDDRLGPRLLAGAGARLRRHRGGQRRCSNVCSIARLYRAAELDQVLFTIGLVFVFIASVTLLIGPENQPLTLPRGLQGQIDLGFMTLPHLQHLPDRGRASLIVARAVARLRAHAHGRPDPRRGRQPAHGGIARHQRRSAVHHHLCVRQRHGGARRRARRRIPRARSAIRAQIPGLFPDRGRGRRARPGDRRVLCVAHHRRARLRAEALPAERRHAVHLSRSPSCCCCGGRRACSDGTHDRGHAGIRPRSRASGGACA